jgi:hypothetical protein
VTNAFICDKESLKYAKKEALIFILKYFGGTNLKYAENF